MPSPWRGEMDLKITPAKPLRPCWMPATMLKECNVGKYRKIMGSHLSVITSRLLQMCHCTAYEYSIESILYVSVERRTQIFPQLKFVLERPLICPLKNKWHSKKRVGGVCGVLMKAFCLVWKANGGKIRSRMISFYNGHSSFVPKWPERLHWGLKGFFSSVECDA